MPCSQSTACRMPATTARRSFVLRGNIRGRRLVELGCAAGVLTGQLAERGADVLALDRGPRVVALARQRLRGRARVEVADLDRPLDMADGSVDLIVASLVLHYIQDWRPPLADFTGAWHRAAPSFSVHHPVAGWQLSDRTDYQRTELIRKGGAGTGNR